MKFQSLSTLRLRSGQAAWACSGLTLSGASLSRLKRQGLGATEWVKVRKSKLFDKRGIPLYTL
jgi:hypothetical protein